MGYYCKYRVHNSNHLYTSFYRIVNIFTSMINSILTKSGLREVDGHQGFVFVEAYRMFRTLDPNFWFRNIIRTDFELIDKKQEILRVYDIPCWPTYNTAWNVTRWTFSEQNASIVGFHLTVHRIVHSKVNVLGTRLSFDVVDEIRLLRVASFGNGSRLNADCAIS